MSATNAQSGRGVDLRDHAMRILSAIVALLGAVVMGGWMVESSMIVQIAPTFAPMQFNTALGFLLSGVCMLMICLKHFRVVGGIGVIILLLGIATLAQYIFDIDLKIDQMFVDHSIMTKTSHPGRMAPNTAMCFALMGIISIASSFAFLRKLCYMIAIFSSAMIALSIIALTGYVLNVESAYGWGSLTRMAVHTSLGFLTLGCLASVWAWRMETGDKSDTVIRAWIPVQTAIVLLTAFLLWLVVSQSEARRLEQKLHTEAHAVAAVISLKLEKNNKALERMADRWRNYPEYAEEHWRPDAINYMEDIPGLHALLLVYDNNETYMQQRADDLPEDFDLSPRTNEDIRFVIEQAIRTSKFANGPAFITTNGLHVWFSCIPLLDKEVSGYLITLQSIDPKISTLLQEDRLDDRYMIQVQEDEQMLFEYVPPEMNTSLALKETVAFDQLGIDWTITISPGPRILLSNEANLQMVMAVSIVIIMVLGALTVRLSIQYNSRAEDLRIANASISKSLEEQTKLENRLKQTNEWLSRKNKDLEQVVYSVSHDLQTPLVSIAGFAGFLEQDLKTGNVDQIQESIQCIKNASKRMQDNVESLLDLSRISRSNDNVRPVDLNDIVTQIALMLKPQLNQKNAQIKVLNQLPHVRCDETRLTQVFQNLIQNAVKYGCTAGSPIIEIGTAVHNGTTTIFVQDNGRGIPEDQHDKVFGLFHRLVGSETENGSGIGLAIVRRVIDTMEGSIYVDPAYTDGAKFVIELPDRFVDNSSKH